MVPGVRPAVLLILLLMDGETSPEETLSIMKTMEWGPPSEVHMVMLLHGGDDRVEQGRVNAEASLERWLRMAAPSYDTLPGAPPDTRESPVHRSRCVGAVHRTRHSFCCCNASSRVHRVSH